MPDHLPMGTRNTLGQVSKVLTVAGAILLALVLLEPAVASACSTVKLQKGDALVYGHNLNANGMDVPGLVFVNKRRSSSRAEAGRS